MTTKEFKEYWEQFRDLEFYPDRVCGCGCNSRIKVKFQHQYEGIPEYIPGHYTRVFHPTNNLETRKKIGNSLRIPNEIRKCVCGCEGTFECKINSKQKYILGHNNYVGNNRKGKFHYPKEIRTCIAPECNNTFEVPSNSGKRYCSRNCSNKYCGMTGKKHKESTKQITGKKNRKNATESWKNVNFRVKQARARLKIKQNGVEKILENILCKIFPDQWKFVGDWSFVINGKCPDFIHTSKKLIIELFGDYWHGEKRTGIPNEIHEQERIQIFESEGYKTLIIWEHELENFKFLQEKLLKFNNILRRS